jgi:hypothetical protein
VTLERRGGDVPLRQAQPGEYVWFEVRPPAQRAGAPPPTFAWQMERAFDKLAPAWTLGVRQWPSAQDAPTGLELRAWWGNPAQSREFAVAVPLDGGYRQRPVTWPGSADVVAEIEDYRVEPHFVRGSNQPEGNCLAIRLRYSPDQPVFVRFKTGGTAATNEEHRYYLAADRYTGLFWPIPAQRAERSDTVLEIVSVSKLKASAQKSSRTANVRLPLPTQ